jgi:hypothetical protein
VNESTAEIPSISGADLRAVLSAIANFGICERGVAHICNAFAALQSRNRAVSPASQNQKDEEFELWRTAKSGDRFLAEIKARGKSAAELRLRPLEPVAEKLIDFSDQNRLQLFDFKPLLLARVIQPERQRL